ncbi:MAG: cytochrome c [Anaeromyxobacter sp.]
MAAAVGGALVAGALVVFVLAGGVSARPEPGRIEATIARTLRHFAIPEAARGRENPIRLDDRTLAQGLAHFADHCASCHGNDGSGATALGRGLYPRAPDMRLPATQDLSDGELFFIIEHGVRLTGMPAWGGAGQPEESWKLVHFIRHLEDLTPDELAHMEQLNPRSPDEWRELQEEDEFLQGGAPPAGGLHEMH